MRDGELYAKLLGIKAPWKVRNVDVRLKAGEVEVFSEHGGSKLVCPECAAKCSGYDTRTRTWRHLDTMQFRTLLKPGFVHDRLLSCAALALPG